MKLSSGVRLLRILDSREANALTTTEIASKWRGLGGEGISLRSIQRYMTDLAEDGAGGQPALVAISRINLGKKKQELRYYLRPSQVANWFMTEDVALDLQLTQQVLGRTFGSRGLSNGDKIADMAESVTAASPETRRIRERLRIVPDGIGRLPARIDSSNLKAAIDAVGKDRKLRFSYLNASGKLSTQLVSPLGLVAKDGTVYLVGIKGLSDTPRHFALHRMSEADVHFQATQSRPDFDLDRYIAQSHQFSHALDASATPEQLKLRVAPEAMFHFTERPLSTDQVIKAPAASGNWSVVTATVPDTVLLVPFLVSMGPYLEVLEPAHIRNKTAEWLRDSHALYVKKTLS